MAASAPQPLRLCGITVPNNDVHKNKELALSAASQNPNFVEKAVLVSQNALWENGKILDYSFFGGTQIQRAKVEDVIQEWTWYANITFRRSTDNNAQATLRIAFDPTKGSWSYVGNTAKSCVGPAPTINLGWISDTDTLTKKERGVILHEFGHVLGLMHEHESPARSGVLRLKEKEIIQYYTETQGWDEATVRKQVLDVYSMESVSNYSQFDPTSIMMYFMPGSMNEGGVDIHEVTELSMLDKAFIVANYPRSTPHPRAQQWTPGFALVAAGARADTITAYDRTTDVDEKRSIFTRDMIDRRLLDNKLHRQTAVQRAPNVQTGFNTSFKPSPSSDDKFIQDILNQLNFGGPKAAFKKPDGVQHAVQAAHAEMVQNGILGMLLQIAPMVLLAPNIPALGSSQVAHAVLDPNNLSLEHPVVQHGLLNFFSKLASNETVKKVMAGAVKVAGGVVSDFVGNIFPQNALDTSALDPQNGLLTDGFAMLVRKVVAHPIFQDAVKDIAGVTNHSGVQHLAYNNLAYTEPQNAVQFAVHSEKVQNGILSLLLGIAPKVLLAPNIPASGPSEVSHAVLDPHNLSLEHPVVQHGLMNFFTTLASNDIVKKVMAGAVKVAGGVVSDLVGNLIPQTQNAFNTQNVFSTQNANYNNNANYTQNAVSTQNANYNYNANTQNAFNTQSANNDQDAFNTTIFEPQNGIIGDGLAALVKKIVEHKLFKDTLDLARSVGIQNAAYQGYQASDPTELAFKQRMNKTLTEIWRRGGPTAGEHILRHMERVLENPV